MLKEPNAGDGVEI